MAHQEFRINVPITVSFDSSETISPLQVIKHIFKILEWYDDGRYNLERECIDRDMTEIVKCAISNTVHEMMKKKYPGEEMVETKNGCSINRVMIESIKMFEQVQFIGASVYTDE